MRLYSTTPLVTMKSVRATTLLNLETQHAFCDASISTQPKVWEHKNQNFIDSKTKHKRERDLITNSHFGYINLREWLPGLRRDKSVATQFRKWTTQGFVFMNLQGRGALNPKELFFQLAVRSFDRIGSTPHQDAL